MFEKVMALTFGTIMTVTVANGKIILCTELVLKYGRMEINTKETGIKIKFKDKGNIRL